ncbi:hypothetical protein TD95_004497 [Thielaviopsis punctulata]|uniref:Chitin-binding type-2 domain-containing protein n=1 Tax=Thielaviopsis punctulata TaxID=72032 RepID=A0A0F4ZIS6_9PEZI|nr:hypothetical protein TD95_004497 [Thielaviopsis punctulata]
MKFLAVLVAAASASAAPNPHSPPVAACVPGTYECTTNPDTGCPGWATCDVGKTWVFSGDCPPKTNCFFNTENQSPYCV